MSILISQPLKDSRGNLIVEGGRDVVEWAEILDFSTDYSKKKSKFKDMATLIDDMNSIFEVEPYKNALDGWVENFRDWIGELWAPSIVFDELRLLSTRYPYNYKHVLTIAVVGSRLMELWINAPTTLKKAFLALICHDLGKSRVSEFVLEKRGPLNDAEWKEIHQAPIMSYALNVAYWGQPNHLCANIALNHSEDRVGKGYPRGIKTNSLILDVVGLLDRFDALISERPYREKKYSSREAFDILKEEVDAGKIEGDVLRAFVALMRKEKVKDLKEIQLGTIGREEE